MTARVGVFSTTPLPASSFTVAGRTLVPLSLTLSRKALPVLAQYPSVCNKRALYILRVYYSQPADPKCMVNEHESTTERLTTDPMQHVYDAV